LVSVIIAIQELSASGRVDLDFEREIDGGEQVVGVLGQHEQQALQVAVDFLRGKPAHEIEKQVELRVVGGLGKDLVHSWLVCG
jgi:hypothetical protein